MIGELLATVTSDRELLSQIGGPLGEAARDAADELAAMHATEARAWRVRITAAMRAPIPPGIRGVHPSWIEAGLVGLPARTRTALAAGAPEPADIWLARWACAAIPPLPAIAPELRTPTSIDDALRLSGEALTSWLVEIGADQLAHALASQPEALRAIARATSDRVLLAATRTKVPPRAGALGPMRDAITRCRVQASGPEMLIRIGARAIAAHTDALSRRQLAARLIRPLGLALEGEMIAHSGTPLDRTPTWTALAA